MRLRTRSSHHTHVWTSVVKFWKQPTGFSAPRAYPKPQREKSLAMPAVPMALSISTSTTVLPSSVPSSDECVPDIKESLRQLEELVGKRTVRQNLEMVAERYLNFHKRALGAICSIFAEPELLEAHRAKLRSQGKGPHTTEGMLLSYIRAEQKIGRIDHQATPEAVTSMLLGGCFYRVFVSQYMGEPMHPAPHAFARKLVDQLLRGAGASDLASDPEPEFSCAD